MNFATWSIRNPVPAILLFILLSIAGFFGFRQLPVANLPDLDLPSITISLTQPDAAPAQLETEVARKVENSLATLSGIKHIRTSITDGQVNITVEFILEKKLSDALIEAKDAVDRVRSDLPTDLQQPSISAVRVGGEATLLYAVSSSRLDEEALSWFVDDTVSKTILGLQGIGKFERVGGVQRQVRVEVDPVRLAAQGVTAGDVSRALKTVEQESSGGRSQLSGAEQAVRTIATVRQARELDKLPIVLNDGRRITLDQVATVSDTIAERSQIALLDGKRAVGFKIYRAKGFDETRIGTAVAGTLRKLQAIDPSLSFTLISGTVDYTREQFDGSMHMLYEGAILAVLVVWWFLRDWRATWVSALALPLSIIPTFAVMYWFGFTLNLITLLALSVVVGILVDDAIVEIENIVRHLRMGKPPLEAARDAAGEIGNAVIATSLTLAAVFVPVAFMPGIAGKFFREFGWTAATAVLFSLLVARLLTPMMAAYLLKPHGEEPAESRLMRWYLGWVDAALRHRARTLWIATGLFVASLALVPFIPATFIPQSDLGRSNLSLELPPGTRLQETAAIAERARALVKDIPELKQVYTAVGSVLDLGDPGATGIGEARKATLVLDWGVADDRERDQRALERDARARLANLAGVRVSYVSSEPGNQLQLVLSGDDPQHLQEASIALERDLRGISGLGSVSSSASLLRPEIQIVPNPARAADLGVATADIAEAARIATSGDYEQRLAKLNLPDRQIPIRVGFAEATLSNPALIGQLRVHGRYGPVPLAAVADIQMGSGPSQISRYQRQRNVTLTAELNGRPLGEVMETVQKLPSVQHLPPGVSFLNTGDAEVFVELFIGFMLAMAAGLICIYMVLLLLFNHALMPLTILTAVPLCAGGAFGALLLTQNMLSLPALIGLLMLIGIATKNSILLVDYAVMAEDEHGMSQHDALIDACRKRAQPIIMTTLAMGAGMMPIALGFAGDSSFRAPMAIAVIGGLITSTLLSLIVIPAAFTVVDDLGEWLTRRFRHRSSHPEHHPASG